MQKVLYSSKDSQQPSRGNGCIFRKVITHEKVRKIAELEAKLEMAVLDNRALRGRNKELNDELQTIKERLKGEQLNKKMVNTAKGTLRHQRNRSQPNMEIENQLSNPTFKYSQPQKIDCYDMVKMQRQEISIYTNNATRKLISSKPTTKECSTISNTPTNKQIPSTIYHKAKLTKRTSDCSKFAQSTFPTVEQIWASTNTVKQPSNKLSYFKQ